MKKTLGGDRVGSGQKMTVELHNYGRSTHNISSVFKTDQACGTIIPCFVDIATDGTKYEIDLFSKIRTLPTNGPIFGTFKHQIEVYRVPIRLYIAALHNNALGIGLKMNKVYMPVATVAPSQVSKGNEDQIAQDSLLAYMGLRGLGTPSPNEGITYTTNCMFELAYWDIYKNYYANKQEEIGAVLAGGEQEANPIKTIYFSQWSMRTSPGGQWGNPGSTSATFKTSRSPYEFQVGNLANASFQADGTNSTIQIETYEPINSATEANELLGQITWGTYKLSNGSKFNLTTGTYPTNTIVLAAAQQQTPTIYPATGQSTATGLQELGIVTFPLSNIDQMREWILQAPQTVPFNISPKINATDVVPEMHVYPYYANYGLETNGNNQPIGMVSKNHQSGLGLKTYLSDRFNNWLNTEWIDGENGINELTSVQVVDGAISMDALIMQKKLFNIMNRIAVSGGSYNDWREAVYGERATRLDESPVYCGGYSCDITFDEVVQTGDGEESPLGSLAGRGASHEEKGGTVTVDIHEPSMLIILESITPRIDYCQGNKWFRRLNTIDDLHKPGLDAMGFQELITDEMAAWDTVIDSAGNKTYFSAGKQPSWIEYMTNVNEVYGDFVTGGALEFMALTRSYQMGDDGRIKDLTTYIDPSLYNKAFADAKLSAKNFWVQIGIDCKARRVMSAKQIPNL